MSARRHAKCWIGIKIGCGDQPCIWPRVGFILLHCLVHVRNGAHTVACVRGEENFEVNVRESVIHKDHHQHALRFVDSGVYVDGVALRVYARTPCLFVNVREWRGGVVTGHALVIRINGLNRSNSGSPTTPASARKRCNAGE